MGNLCLTGQARGGWTLATPHSVIKAPSRKTSRVGRGAMNAGLCPDRGHHIPLEPLCGVQQSGGEGRPGQQRRGNTLPFSACRTVMQHQDRIIDACGSNSDEEYMWPFMQRR